ncbi:MAG: GNAT family N-acetyltransferase [Candidatus Hermodarchaeota archaeon]
MALIIKSLSSDLLDDWIFFFENVGFADNPDWSGCYCRYYHFAGSNKNWGNQTKEDNRDASINLIISGVMHGFLAYLEDRPIGWCNINSRENFAKELYEYDIADSEGKQIAGIVCFLIGHTHRKQGIARKLLNHAITHYKNEGYDIIESYPRVGDLSDAHSYRGPVSMYESEGFVVYKKFKNFYVMRLNL